MNEDRTCANEGTNLTQPRSGFGLEDARRKLIALRVRLGSNTPAGHRCSNVVEQLQHYEAAEGDQRANLAKTIQKQVAELTALASQSDKPQ